VFINENKEALTFAADRSKKVFGEISERKLASEKLNYY
jgi:hypothetical protein